MPAVLSRLEDGEILAVNDAWVQLMDIPRERAVGETTYSLGIWRTREQRNDAIRISSSQGSTAVHEFALPGQSAKTLRLHTKVLSQYTPPLLLTYLTDITREVLAERELREAYHSMEQRLELHAATEKLARVGHWTNATHDEVVHWSPGLYDITGLPAGKPLTRPETRSYLHPDDQARWLEARAACDEREIDFRWLHPDGQLRWFRTRMGRTAVPGNSQTDFGVVQDITAERSVRDRLAEQLSLIKGIAASLPGLMYRGSLSPSGRGAFTFVNDRALDMLEMEPSELEKDSRALFKRVHPDDREELLRTLTLAASSLTVWRNTHRVCLSQGRVRWHSAEAVPHVGADGVVVWHGFTTDVTESRMASQQLERQHRMLDAVRRAQAAFIEAQDQRQSFEQLLDAFLSVTGSARGFVGEVLRDEHDRSFVKMHAVNDLLWDIDSARTYDAQNQWGREVDSLDALFGQVMASGEVVIANQPVLDARSGGLPPGQPPMASFLGLPITAGDKIIAIVGLSNQSGGYSDADVDFLQPLLGTVRQLVMAQRASQERRRSREQLQRTGALLAEKSSALQLTLDSMAQGLALMDAEGRIRVYNRRFLELLDLPESLMSGHPTHNEVVAFQMSRGDLGEDLQLLDPSLRPYLYYQPELMPPEAYLRSTHLGTMIEVTTRLLPGGGWVRTYTDMTPYVQAQQALDAERQRLQWVLEATRPGIWECNLDTGTLSIDARWADMAGYTLEELSPVSLDTWIGLVHPDDLASAKGQLMAHWRGETAHVDLDLRLRHRSGHWVWVNKRGRVHRRDDAGKALFMSGTHLDIHERVVAQEQVRQLNASLELRVAERTAELERSMKDMEAISYSIAHDLRAPLRSVNGFAALIEEEGGDQLSPTVRDMYARIHRSSRNMGQMITDMLELLRVVRVDLDAMPVDMGVLAHAVVDQLAHDLPGARIHVGALPSVMGDATLLRQVLLNLMDNALKYSRHRSEPVITLEFDPGQQAFCLRDNGMGFDMARAQKLFGLFQRLHAGSDVPGTGVGLAIVARIVERHGGRIWAEASPDAGAVFWWTLPTA